MQNSEILAINHQKIDYTTNVAPMARNRAPEPSDFEI